MWKQDILFILEFRFTSCLKVLTTWALPGGTFLEFLREKSTGKIILQHFCHLLHVVQSGVKAVVTADTVADEETLGQCNRESPDLGSHLPLKDGPCSEKHVVG